MRLKFQEKNKKCFIQRGLETETSSIYFAH